MRTVIITGSEGLIGSVVSKHFEESGYNVIRVDLSLGVDLTDEDQVKDFFSKNNADSLVNLFGMNHHMDKNVKCVNDFLEMIKEKNELNNHILLEDEKTRLMCLSGVKQYPMRVKCATLSWHTLTSAINNLQEEINTENN